MNINTIAYAAVQTAGQPGGTGSLVSMLLPIVIIFLVFYLLLIRPQSKKLKKHQEFLSNLKKGDDVITASGIYGRITGIADNAITIEISEGVKIKVEKSYIAGYAATTSATAIDKNKTGNPGS